jgi:1-acyl-sn-glycerol-3-phosphate acyltransferase
LVRALHTLFIWLCGISFIVFSWFICPILSILGFNTLAVYHGAIVWLARLTLFVTGCKRIYEGNGNFPKKGPVIFIANHQSFYDTFMLEHLPFRFRFLMDDWLAKWPFYGKLCLKAGYVTIKEDSPTDCTRAAMEVIHLINTGESFVIFPEGERSRNGQVKEFHDGIALIVLAAKVPVIPIAFSGTGRVLRRGGFLACSGPIKMKIGKPMTFENYPEINKIAVKEVKTQLRNRIVEMLSEMESNPT